MKPSFSYGFPMVSYGNPHHLLRWNPFWSAVGRPPPSHRIAGRKEGPGHRIRLGTIGCGERIQQAWPLVNLQKTMKNMGNHGKSQFLMAKKYS